MSALHPIFAAVLDKHYGPPHPQLDRALRKANARRFNGEPPTGFDAFARAMNRVDPRSFIGANRDAPTPTLNERMASDIGALAAEADNLDTCEYIGYGAVREHLEAAIAALGRCGVRSDEDIEREAAENASEARGEAQRDGDDSGAP